MKSKIFEGLKTASDVASVARRVVKDVVVGSLKDAGEVAANTAVFAGTVKAAIIGLSDAGRGATEGVKGAMSGALAAAQELGGDLGTAARGAMEGAIQAATEIGGDSGKLIKDAADGVIDSAADLGEHALGRVRAGLLEVAALPKELIDRVTGSAK